MPLQGVEKIVIKKHSTNHVAATVGGGGGRTHLLLALVIYHLTTQPFRDIAPILLPIDLGVHYTFFPVLHVFPCLSHPLPVSVCGRHLSPTIAIVFSLLSSLPNSSTSPSSSPLIASSNISRSSLHIPCSPTTYVTPTLYCCATRAHVISLPTSSSSSRLLVYPFLRFGRSRSPTRNRSFSFLAPSSKN